MLSASAGADTRMPAAGIGTACIGSTVTVVRLDVTIRPSAVISGAAVADGAAGRAGFVTADASGAAIATWSEVGFAAACWTTVAVRCAESATFSSTGADAMDVAGLPEAVAGFAFAGLLVAGLALAEVAGVAAVVVPAVAPLGVSLTTV